ncbi:MAG: DUF3037 domain-containing protein [Xanthomonadales bacterium]|nr:DUF3037 domain-containing protein [Xanthomonadales bacterium]
MKARRAAPTRRRGCLNVGAIVSSASAKFLAARIELDKARLRAFDPGVDVEAVATHLAAIVRICQGGAESRIRSGQLGPRSLALDYRPVRSSRLAAITSADDLASRIVWLDHLVSNVDRTPAQCQHDDLAPAPLRTRWRGPDFHRLTGRSGAHGRIVPARDCRCALASRLLTTAAGADSIMPCAASPCISPSRHDPAAWQAACSDADRHRQADWAPPNVQGTASRLSSRRPSMPRPITPLTLLRGHAQREEFIRRRRHASSVTASIRSTHRARRSPYSDGVIQPDLADPAH